LKFETFNDDYVRRLTDGDSDAGAHFAAYFGDVLFMKLQVRLRSRHLLEDVRQETFVRVLAILRQSNGVEHPDRFGAFVNGVCENVMRELERSDKRAEPWDPRRMEDPIDPTEDPDATLTNAESRRKIEEILSQLTEKDRKILRAIFLDEMDKAEVCRVFEVEPRYFRVLLFRAKHQFREAYNRCHGNCGGSSGRNCKGAPPVNPNGE
jgi:RNA polymerase sigma-70 factor (ECF subfamily)